MKKLLLLALGLVAISGVFYVLQEKQKPDVTTNTVTEASLNKFVYLKDGDTYNLTASYVTKVIGGKTQRMLAYNGSVPGPTIRVPQGAEITINFTNNTDEPTLLHSHGVRMDNAFDGSQLQQKDIPPGGRFTYKLKFPDAGVFWYHPHLHEVSQQALGLYGNFVVIAANTSYWEPVNEEVPLILSDILVENDGTIAPFTNPSNYALMGRYGNDLLINGSDQYKLSVKQGEVTRFYLTNAANTRVFNITIPGAKMKLVGADNGRYEHESFVDSILLGPSERAVVDVLFEKTGSYAIEHVTPSHAYQIGVVSVSGDAISESYASQFSVLHSNTDIEQAIPNLNAYFSKTPDKNLALTVDMGSMGMSGSHQMPGGQMMQNGGGMHMMQNGSMMQSGSTMMGSNDGEKIEWEDSMAMMNEMSTVNMIKWKIVDRATGLSGDNLNWSFKKGDLVKIRIYNDPNSPHPMQHPIHFHGQRFLVLATNGVENSNLVWKDTTLVQKGDTVDILVDMSNPGIWMAHCHISEHLESGMMFKFNVTQ